MNTPRQNFSEVGYLKVCMAYCMTWELAGMRAPEHWSRIRDLVRGMDALNERDRWALELYEEGPPSAQEERSLLSRVEAQTIRPKDSLVFRDRVLELLPEALRHAAAGHSLLRRLAIHSEYNKIKLWLSKGRLRSKEAPVSLSDRELEFNRFLELPYFLEAFREFWRMPPKERTNRQTRALVCLGAVLSQMIEVARTADYEPWVKRLAQECHFSVQTQADLLKLIQAMAGFSYDAQELVYHLSIDLEPIDQGNLWSFIEHYRGELSDFARELPQGPEQCLG